MHKRSTLFLQAVIVAIGIVVLAVMIRFPLTEGRAVGLDLFHIYADPFIMYGYVVSIAFFVALYQAFSVLGYIRRDQTFSLSSVKALKIIRYCAIMLSISVVAAALFIRIFHADDDDPAGFIAVAIVITIMSVVVATAAHVLEQIVQRVMDAQSKNDVTV